MIREKCPRGHPLADDYCIMCKEDDERIAAEDDKLLAALRRLHEAGKLAPFIEGVLTIHD